MAIAEETVESGAAGIGQSNQATKEYIVFGVDGDDEAACDLAALTESPLFFRSYPRRSLSGKTLRITPTMIRVVTVDYGVDQQQTPLSNPTGLALPGTSQFDTTRTFNLIGGTEHIKTAISTVSYPDGFAKDVKKVIGLDLKTGQVRGVNIFAPVCDFTLTTQFRNEVVTEEYIDLLTDLTGTVNSETFFRRPAGSVLFKGARGSKRGQENWEIGFEFAYSRNRENIDVGGITVASKKGWEYMDVMYREDPSQEIGGQPLQVPAQVNIHVVYEDGDFSGLKIGT